MRSPEAPTASNSLASGTPSNLRGPSYHGVAVENDFWPSASSIARSNWADPSLLVTLILPVTVKIGLSEGAGREAAPARWPAAATAAAKTGAASNRSADRLNIWIPPAKDV